MDTISLVCALLVRFPELVSIRSTARGEIRLTFAVRSRLTAKEQSRVGDAVSDHVLGYLLLSKETPGALRVECECDRSTTFVHITRDTGSFSKEELELLIALLRDQFADALACNPPTSDAADADPEVQDQLAAAAIEAIRDPAQFRGLVGFREEAQVLVYFLKTQHKRRRA